jgi:two-component system invasion response regulator UvrY
MIRILIVDDYAILRRRLKEILVRELPGVVCGEAQDAQQVLVQVESRDWDLVILDITMPGRSGLQVLEDVKAMRPELPVLVLSMHSENQYGKRVLRAGASGYMSKRSAPEELINAIRKLLAGGQYVSPALAERLALDLAHNSARSEH